MPKRKQLFAAAYAAQLHSGQRRKGAGDIPYVNHVLDVAARLESAHPDDHVLIIAGLLHDVVEDCADWSDRPEGPTPDVFCAEIRDLFGAEVLAVVDEVTDDKREAKAARKARQMAEVSGKSERAKRLKLADKTSNVLAIAETPPDWTLARMQDYLDWAEAVIAGARGVSEPLETAFDAAISQARNRIKEIEE